MSPWSHSISLRSLVAMRRHSSAASHPSLSPPSPLSSPLLPPPPPPPLLPPSPPPPPPPAGREAASSAAPSWCLRSVRPAFAFLCSPLNAALPSCDVRPPRPSSSTRTGGVVVRRPRSPRSSPRLPPARRTSADGAPTRPGQLDQVCRDFSRSRPYHRRTECAVCKGLRFSLVPFHKIATCRTNVHIPLNPRAPPRQFCVSNAADISPASHVEAPSRNAPRAVEKEQR